jgi:hypothetical protein
MTCATAETILTLNRGTDLLHDIFFEDDNGDPINMFGWTVSIFEADAWMQTNVTVAWKDQTAGIATVRANWTPNAPSSASLRVAFTRTLDGYDETSNILKVVWS